MKQNPLASALALCVLFSACAPAPQAQRDPRPAPKPTPPAKAGPTVPVAQPRVFDESLLRGREFLLEVPSGPVSQARDPDLGTLETEAAVVQAVDGFLRAAAEGKLEAETLAPRWSDYLQGWAAGFQKSAPRLKTVRVGRSLVQEGSVMAPVHLVLEDKALTGWVVLVRSGGSLLVSDVQIVESAARTSPFDPESPQEISSPSLR